MYITCPITPLQDYSLLLSCNVNPVNKVMQNANRKCRQASFISGTKKRYYGLTKVGGQCKTFHAFNLLH